MNRRKWPTVVLLFVLGMIGSTVQTLWAAARKSWGGVLPGLYYLPIIVAACKLGPKAAVRVALAAGVCQAIVAAAGFDDSWFQAIGQTVLFVCVGLIAGKLATWPPSTGSGGYAGFPAHPAQVLERTFSQLGATGDMPALVQMEIALVRQLFTPVASIQGASWVLEDPGLPRDRREEFVGIIRKEAHRLVQTLWNLLSFAQPRQPVYRDVDLAVLLDEVIQLAKATEHGPYFLFRRELAHDLPLLRCDPEQIKRMLLNVVINSIEATPGAGEITIAAHGDRNSVVIQVRDHGRGIPVEILGKICDPFFSTRDNGLGLGLTVARQIAVAHGGDLAVETTSCKGTSISIQLPQNGAVRA